MRKQVATLAKDNQKLETLLTDPDFQPGGSPQASAQAAQLSQQLAAARARIEVLEAKKIPYTAEELALFKVPRISLPPPPKMAKASAKPAAAASPSGDAPAASRNASAPAATGLLVAEAQRAFGERRFTEAEAKYAAALNLDERSVFTLSNLAATQLEQNKLPEAEATLKRALSADANDPYSLSLLGLLKFRQEKYDEALDSLSRAAQLDPKNAQTQNYLGMALAQKAQRPAAETAFRKAVQLSPNYGEAHFNLAVFYSSQQPPSKELAKWHYQRALSAGLGRSADLEKVMNQE